MSTSTSTSYHEGEKEGDEEAEKEEEEEEREWELELNSYQARQWFPRGSYSSSSLPSPLPKKEEILMQRNSKN
jgi:hypothetical protein